MAIISDVAGGKLEGVRSSFIKWLPFLLNLFVNEVTEYSLVRIYYRERHYSHWLPTQLAQDSALAFFLRAIYNLQCRDMRSTVSL